MAACRVTQLKKVTLIEIPHPNVLRRPATPASPAPGISPAVRDDLAIRLRQPAARSLETPA
jgi:hypothetical protein